MVVKFTRVVFKQSFRKIMSMFFDPLVFWRGSDLLAACCSCSFDFFCWIVFPFLHVASEPCRFSFGPSGQLEALLHAKCFFWNNRFDLRAVSSPSIANICRIGTSANNEHCEGRKHCQQAKRAATKISSGWKGVDI